MRRPDGAPTAPVTTPAATPAAKSQASRVRNLIMDASSKWRAPYHKMGRAFVSLAADTRAFWAGTLEPQSARSVVPVLHNRNSLPSILVKARAMEMTMITGMHAVVYTRNAEA